MQAERTWLARQVHVRLVRQTIALAIVAVMAASHQVLPRRITPAGSWNDMVERQLARRHHLGAILAGVAIPHQGVLARERPRLIRNADVLAREPPRLIRNAPILEQ